MTRSSCSTRSLTIAASPARRRSALIIRGLEQAGPPGSLAPYPPTDEGGWPVSSEVRLELVRRRLVGMSQAGSAVATVALERRSPASVPQRHGKSATVDEDDPFREVDELAEKAASRSSVGADLEAEPATDPLGLALSIARTSLSRRTRRRSTFRARAQAPAPLPSSRGRSAVPGCT